MNHHFNAFISQPLLMEFGFAERLSAMLREGTSADIKGLFFNAPCPKAAAERAAMDAKSHGSNQRKSVAVIPIRGALDQHGSWMMDMLGGTPVDFLSEAHDILMNESRIGGILYDCHSPGGYAFGIKEFGDKVYASRGDKLQVSVSNSMMCSACCWIGASADRSFASPMSMNASVGVYNELWDRTKSNEQDGLNVKIVRIPEGKAEGHPDEPITDQIMANELGEITKMYAEFVTSLAKYRGATKEQVKSDFGNGRTMTAADAAKAGLVDGVRSFDDVLRAMQAGSVRRQSSGAVAIVDDAVPQVDAGTMRRRWEFEQLALTTNRPTL